MLITANCSLKTGNQVPSVSPKMRKLLQFYIFLIELSALCVKSEIEKEKIMFGSLLLTLQILKNPEKSCKTSIKVAPGEKH